MRCCTQADVCAEGAIAYRGAQSAFRDLNPAIAGRIEVLAAGCTGRSSVMHALVTFLCLRERGTGSSPRSIGFSGLFAVILAFCSTMTAWAGTLPYQMGTYWRTANYVETDAATPDASCTLYRNLFYPTTPPAPAEKNESNGTWGCPIREFWGPGTGTVYWGIGQGSKLMCPANSTLDANGTTCTCNSKYGESGGQCIPTAVTDVTQAPQKCPMGNPVFPLTGAKKEFLNTGVSVGGTPLVLTYDTTSRLPANQPDTATIGESTAFGSLWTSNLHRSLQVAPNLTRAVVSRGDGTVLNFVGDGAGAFTAVGGHSNRLAAVTGGYRLTDVGAASLETYDAQGVLTRIEMASGRTLSFTYDGAVLSTVQDDYGRFVRFNSGAEGRVTSIGGSAGTQIGIGYDANKNLTSITWPDGKSQGFLYESASLPWALTGKVDENGSRYATFDYDAQGRAILSEHAGGADRHEFSYGTAAQRFFVDSLDAAAGVLTRTVTWTQPGDVTVVRPNGQATTLGSQLVAGSPMLTAQSQPAGSGCAASTNAATFDANGNVLSLDDFQGARTCYAYDSSNRETLRVEGLPTSASCESMLPASAVLPEGARRIAKVWHPDWNLPVQVIQPKLRTTTVYHGQPDPLTGGQPASCSSAPARSDGKPLPLVCKVVEQALLGSGAVDPATPIRYRSFTYDSAGRVLTATNERNHSTTYAYYGTASFALDPHMEKVALLLHGDGNDGSTAFVDSSPTAKVLTASGSGPSIRTAASKFGGASLAFTGGAALGAGIGQDWTFTASDDYTVEFWFYRTAGAGSTACMVATNGNNRWSFFWRGASNRAAVYCAACGSFMESATILQLNRWYHYALTKQGSTFRLFIDGVLETTASSSQATDAANVSLNVGGGFGGEYFSGYIDDVRITKGVARYTASFAPPARAYPDPLSWTSVGYMPGDLQSVMNAAGHATHFTGYDPAGRVRQSVDSKGITSDVTYTNRGALASFASAAPGAAGRTTTYTYDAAGQLTGVATPDGTTTTFAYDAAHRLVGVTDSRGNSITYTLDASGNRIGEDFKDSTGVLRRSVARSFDALNRLQQVTGATE